jgi:hypothetical protein
MPELEISEILPASPAPTDGNRDPALNELGGLQDDPEGHLAQFAETVGIDVNEFKALGLADQFDTVGKACMDAAVTGFLAGDLLRAVRFTELAEISFEMSEAITLALIMTALDENNEEDGTQVV